MDSIQSRQAQFNDSTRRHWHAFASHRRQIERLLVSAIDQRPPGGPLRLCVLGAGNCNDLDLPWLASLFTRVELIDIDPDALSGAVKRQCVESVAHLHRHAPIDLSGVAGFVGEWRTAALGAQLPIAAAPPRSTPSADQLNACIRRAAEWTIDWDPRTAWQGSFDVVLSPCILSQIIMPMRDVLGERHPRFAAFLTALRGRHLRLMAELLAPGGAGVLVTDVVSCGSVPGLARVAHEDLPDLLRKLVDDANVFKGLDPVSLRRAFGADPLLAAEVDDVQTTPPWLWHLGWRRTYLAYALRFRKRLKPASSFGPVNAVSIYAPAGR